MLFHQKKNNKTIAISKRCKGCRVECWRNSPYLVFTTTHQALNSFPTNGEHELGLESHEKIAF